MAGSAYTYTQKTFGAPVGFLAGWSLLLDYLFLPMLNYLVIGHLPERGDPRRPAWVFIVVAIAIVTVLNIVGIVSVARANFVHHRGPDHLHRGVRRDGHRRDDPSSAPSTSMAPFSR